jgi:Flp pilus assembly protein TadD
VGLYNLAMVHIKMGRLEPAEQELVNALKSMRDPTPVVYANLAEVEDAVGDQEIS